MSISVGEKIPNFVAQTTNGTLSNSDLLGKFTVFYFYPKDNTPGCSCEANDFNALYSKFQAANAEVIGISRDSLASHNKFKDAKKLQFNLIADVDSKICDIFDVIKSKSIFGKTAFGLVRSTFLIDPQGILIHEWRKVSVKNHAQEVLEILKSVNQTPRDC